MLQNVVETTTSALLPARNEGSHKCRLVQQSRCDDCPAGMSLGGSTSAADTDADLESHYRSADGSEAAAIRGWSTEVRPSDLKSKDLPVALDDVPWQSNVQPGRQLKTL